MRQFQAEETVAALAASRGWPTVADLPGDESRGVPRRVAWQISPGATLNFFRDDSLGISYVSVMSGLGKDFAEQLTSMVHTEIDVYGDAELLSGMSGADDDQERALAVLKAGLGAPLEFSEKFYAGFVAASEHTTSTVRNAAVRAMYYTKWQEFTNVLAELASSDPDSAVRDFAGRVLTAVGGTGS
ncbi:hypothetical protein ACIRU5_28020 [Streptomyces misionensis]|uniref:hypothetical protein n=1 Tax=Streptomyces misionensis TaxID=67331 RepID=UPI00380EB4C8